MAIFARSVSLAHLQLPEGTGISKDAKTAFGMAAQIFVAYATAT